MKLLKAFGVFAVVVAVAVGSVRAKDHDDNNKKSSKDKANSGTHSNPSRGSGQSSRDATSPANGDSQGKPSGQATKPGETDKFNQGDKSSQTEKSGQADSRSTRSTEIRPGSVPLMAKNTPNGGQIKTTPSGQVREKSE